MKSPPRIPLLLIAAALSLAQANAATISKSSGSTTPTLSEFNAQFSGHPRKVGYGDNSPNGMFLETFRMECGRAGIAKAQLDVRLTKLTQGANRADNDALALWSGGNQGFSTYLWKATDPAGASKALSLDLSALPTNAATGVITAPPGGNGLGLLAAGTLSFSVQDDTRVTAATLTYDCARPRADGNAVMAPPGQVLARPLVVPGTPTSPSTITKTATASTVTAPSGTVKWVINVNNQQGNNVPVTVNDPAPAGSTINVGSVQAPPGWNSSATTTSNLNVSGTMGSNSNSFTFPFTSPSTATAFSQQTGGDGQRPFLHGNNVYALFHHTNNSNMLYCADATTGIKCLNSPWGISTALNAPVVPSGGPLNDFTTTNFYPEQITGGKVYFFARTVMPPSKPVVVCVDLNPPTPTTCGYHVYATSTVMTNSLLNGAAWNGRLYAHSGNGRCAACRT